MILQLLVLTQYQRVTYRRTGRRTDGQTDTRLKSRIRGYEQTNKHTVTNTDDRTNTSPAVAGRGTRH